MKLYLKSGQVMKLNEVHTVVINNVSYSVDTTTDEITAIMVNGEEEL